MPGKKSKETALTWTDLMRFFKEVIKPEFDQLVSRDDIQSFRSEVNGRFDDLYKKFEDLRQEYIVANQQMKRLEKNDELLREELSDLKSKVLSLHERIEELEKRLTPH